MNYNRKFDKKKQFGEKYILKDDLMNHLQKEGIANPKGNLKQLQIQAKVLDLPIKFTYEKTITGWVGKPKGSLQILYERGWIDPDKLSGYTEKRKMSEMGVLRKDKSLKILME